MHTMKGLLPIGKAQKHSGKGSAYSAFDRAEFSNYYSHFSSLKTPTSLLPISKEWGVIDKFMHVTNMHMYVHK